MFPIISTMKFPESWLNTKRKVENTENLSKKKQKLNTQKNVLEITTSDQVVCEIRNSLTNHRDDVEEKHLELDPLLSKLPFREMMENMFTSSKNNVNVPVISLAYEEAFLRESVGKERPCLRGNQCEAMFIDPKNPFICTEFLLPDEDITNERQFCVLCCRKITKQLFFDMMYEGHRYQGSIQRYGNCCDQPGEYAKEAMLCCPVKGPVHCMPLPIVNHRRSNLEVKNEGGLRHIIQHRVKYDDFQ